MKSKFTVKVDCGDLEPQWDFTEMNELALAAIKERVEEQIAKEERAVLDYIRDRAHDLTTCPHDMIMDGDLGAFITFDTLPNRLIRFDIPPAFLRFPRALPIKLKGIA